MRPLITTLMSLLTIVLLGYTSLNAQTLSEEVDLMQSIYGMEKKSVIAEFLGDSVNDEFWTVYDAYEAERKILGKNRIGLINNYVENYASIDGAVADEVVKSAQKLSKNLTNLISKYTKKVRKVAGSKVAAQFYQIENYLLSATRTELMESMPFIGDMKKN